MIRTAAFAALGAAALAGPAAAACTAPGAAEALSIDQAAAVYDCLKAEMLEGYSQGPKRWIPAEFVAEYRSWTPASTGPAAPGVHGERMLMTYVNPVGADTYLRYADEGVEMPAGSVIAKESFTVDGAGKAAPGPLFFMQKVAEGVSPETNDWFYMMVARNGTPMAVPVVQACHGCHSGYEGSDGMGYPDESVRIAR